MKLVGFFNQLNNYDYYYYFGTRVVFSPSLDTRHCGSNITQYYNSYVAFFWHFKPDRRCYCIVCGAQAQLFPQVL